MPAMRCCLAAVLVAAVTPLTASAHFRLFARPQEARAYYYCPVPVVAVVPTPVIAVPVAPVAPAPVMTLPVLPVAPPQVVAPGPVVAPPVAAPAPAPPSPAPVVPVPSAPPTMPPAGPSASTSEKARDSFYDVYPSTERSALAGRAAVAVWNLSGGTLTLTVAGRRHTLPPGRNLSLDLDREFSWQLEGRDTEVTRVPAGETGATLVIRR
jgi:hypothetical protein